MLAQGDFCFRFYAVCTFRRWTNRFILTLFTAEEHYLVFSLSSSLFFSRSAVKAGEYYRWNSWVIKTQIVNCLTANAVILSFGVHRILARTTSNFVWRHWALQNHVIWVQAIRKCLGTMTLRFLELVEAWALIWKIRWLITFRIGRQVLSFYSKTILNFRNLIPRSYQSFNMFKICFDKHI